MSSLAGTPSKPVEFSSHDTQLILNLRQDYPWQGYEPIEEGFHLSRLHEQAFKRALYIRLDADPVYRQKFRALQHELKASNLNESREKELIQNGTSFSDENFSKCKRAQILDMKAVDCSNISKLVTITAYYTQNDAENGEKQKSAKKKAKKANVIHSGNKHIKKRAVPIQLDSEGELVPPQIKTGKKHNRSNNENAANQDSQDSITSYRQIKPYKPDVEIISLSESSDDSEWEPSKPQNESKFSLAQSVKNCFKSLLQTRKSGGVQEEFYSCFSCGEKFSQQEILKQHQENCYKAGQVLESQRTPHFVQSQGSSGFSFRWSVPSSQPLQFEEPVREQTTKSVIIDLDPQAPEMENWVISQHMNDEPLLPSPSQTSSKKEEAIVKAFEPIIEKSLSLPSPDPDPISDIRNNNALEPQMQSDIVATPELFEGTLQSFRKQISFQEPPSFEHSAAQVINFSKQEVSQKNSVISQESTAQSQTDPRRVQWLTNYLRRKSQICPYCSEQIKNAKNRLDMKAHMSQCMNHYLKFGVKKKWAIQTRTKV